MQSISLVIGGTPPGMAETLAISRPRARQAIKERVVMCIFTIWYDLRLGEVESWLDTRGLI